MAFYPTGLQAKGRKLWDDILADFDLRPEELRILEDACREADLIDRIEKEIQTSPLTAKGSQGQPVAAPLVTEIRQHRTTLARLLGQLKLTSEGSAVAGMTTSEKARHAANARWGKAAAERGA